jgi:DNA polymerase-3 subunit alpha
VQIIEPYTNAGGATVTVEGRTLPGLCLVEDEEGIRWLLSAYHDEVHAPTWARAAAAGAAGIIVPGTALLDAMGLPQRHRAVSAERFAEQRHERTPNYVIPAGAWSYYESIPTYREVMEGRPGLLVVPKSSGFVHLHAHSEYSPLDGLSTVPEMVEQVVLAGQGALALTDHGRCAGHPQLQKVCLANGIDPIFGIEAYFVDDRVERPEPGDKEALQRLKNGYFHLVLWATDTEGLHNLWAMSTESFRDGMYYKPRMDWDTLRKYAKGVVASSACLRGPLSVPILNDDEDGARRNLGRLLEIFGDRFYLELQPNRLPEQEKVNRALVGIAKDYGVPLLATVDSHYPKRTDHDAHEAWIALQTNSDVGDEGDLFAVNLDLYMQDEQTVREGLAYLGQDVVDESVSNTMAVARMCTARIEGTPTAPVYSKRGGADRDADRLLELCVANWGKVAAQPDQEFYMARFEREFALLRRKGFCGYFLMVSDYCKYAKDNGVLVGPGRGSGSGSLVAYLCDITEVDPVAAKISFERFMTEGRTSLPDFDVDFPASKKEFMLQYLRDKYGDQYVISIGTQTRLHAKGIVKDLGRALRSVLLDGMDPEHAAQYSTEIDRDLALVSKIVTEAEAGTAGLGMSWEDLWAQYGDVLDPYREKYPQIFDMADRLVGRLKTYSKHAAGVVISTDRPLTSWLPLFGGGQPGEQMVSQFDMGSLEEIGEVKFDILTIRNLDTIQRAVDLIWEQRGVRVDIYHWDREYEDPQVWEGISEGRTLGIFQIETKSGTRLALRMKPQNMADLSDMNTIVRPGPMRSGLTEIYLKRRAGEEEVTYQDPRLEKITGEAQGCVIYQDHILLLLMDLAGYGSDEADEVRKILGKKKVEKVAAAGQEFIQRAQEWGGMERATVEHLWEQLAEFAKYTFPKGHSYAYSMITYWTAWLKFHYPVEFFTAALSTVDKDRIPAFIKEVRRAGYTVHPPDVNLSGMGFKAEPLAVRYGLDAIDGVGGVAVEAVLEGQPYRDLDDFLERKGKKADAGIVLRLAQVGALDSMMPNRAGLVALLTGQKDGSATRCQHLADGPAQGFSEDFPAPPHATRHCTFDWSGEPAPVNPRTLKLLPHKPPPKKCTRACRQYLAPPPLDALTVEPYDDEQVRTLEHALLGVFLSSTPFDRLDPTDRANLLADAQELVTGRPRFYTVAAILMAVRRTKTRASGDAMAFVTLDTETDTVEAVVFPRKWEEIQTGMHPGQLCLVVLEKQADERGFILSEYMPVP